MSVTTSVQRDTFLSGADRTAGLLDRALIYGTIVLIPYDLPVVHQACVPLAAVALLLMLIRQDTIEFLSFVRRLWWAAVPMFLVCVLGVFSLYGNLVAILGSSFQEQSGWTRGVLQGCLLLVTSFFPFYFAFCLSKHADWEAMIVRGAWWSLPLPLFVGILQIANLVGVPGLAHLPYVGQAYTGGFFRVTSVARESSWFGSFTCVVLPFLVLSMAQMQRGWRKRGAGAAIAVLLVVFALGFSKSAYGGLVLEIGLGLSIILVVRRPWRAVGKAFFALLLFVIQLFIMAVIAPSAFARLTHPFVQQAEVIYALFEPLLLGNTNTLSIGTRFGMSAAGTAMGEAHPILGVGLGQFGFHAHSYLPLWGLNPETSDWLSNDTGEWPSTSNLYTRFLAEIGLLGFCAYIAFRVVLAAALGMRLLRADSPTWWRDGKIFCIMLAMVAFDFHRDSFINLDVWAVLGMAMASVQTARPAIVAERLNGHRTYRFFGITAAIGFCVALCVVLLPPISYQADATIIPKLSTVSIQAQIPVAPKIGGLTISLPDIPDMAPAVTQMGQAGSSFDLFRTYWASRAVAARLIRRHTDLVRAVLGKGGRATPSTLANYIESNITLVTADKQGVITLQYRNADPNLAKSFLVAAIMETDLAVAETAAVRARQAAQLSQMAMRDGLDHQARRDLISRSVAQELQSSFDMAGESSSFDYVEHPGLSSAPSPQPLIAVLMALLLGSLAAATATIGRLILLAEA